MEVGKLFPKRIIFDRSNFDDISQRGLVIVSIVVFFLRLCFFEFDGLDYTDFADIFLLLWRENNILLMLGILEVLLTLMLNKRDWLLDWWRVFLVHVLLADVKWVLVIV